MYSAGVYSFASDQQGNEHYPYVKLTVGALELSAGNPAPVSLRDSNGNGLTSATRGSEQALSVQIVDDGGNQITSLGGGLVSNNGTFPVQNTAAIPTGANVIGAVTQSGTWNIGAITTLPALPAGANVIGGVTQSGTWNLGSISSALPTGANVIGGVTQSGTWNVTVNAALPTGANTIGAVTQSGTWNIGSITTLPTLANVTTVGTVTTLSTLTNITNWGNVVDNAAFTDGTTRLSISGYIFDEVAGTALTENDAAAARVNANRAQVMTIEDSSTRGQRQSVNTSGGASITPVPHTAGGLSKAKIHSAASTNATNVKASAAQLYGWALFNTAAAAKFVKIHNTAGTPTAGASVDFTIMIPANSGTNVEWSHGIPYATGIGYTITGAVAETDTTNVAAGDVVGILLYK